MLTSAFDLDLLYNFYSTLASLNLPAAIETTDGNTLPPSILEKAETVKNMGGITQLDKLINDLPELLKRNQDILDEVMQTI